MSVRFTPGKNQGLSVCGGHVRVVFHLFLLLLIFVFPGCRRSSDEPPLVPPETHPLTRAFIGYGVVSGSFTHLLNEPGSSGVSRGYLRRGTVVRVIERRQLIIRGGAESWVLAEGNYQGPGNTIQGWLQETTVEIYDNESRAMTASKSMDL